MSLNQIISLLSVVLFLNIYIGSADDVDIVNSGNEDANQLIEVATDSGTGEND